MSWIFESFVKIKNSIKSFDILKLFVYTIATKFKTLIFKRL